jgi:hypothetical protein
MFDIVKHQAGSSFNKNKIALLLNELCPGKANLYRIRSIWKKIGTSIL